ncbi:MAG: response regulator transcription factor [Lachnospiraceae bacterium]|nr:response regulator transcription factor [Lachnospiraceae bacterium]
MAKVLLVEDNEGIAEGLKLSFELNGQQLLVAGTLKEAGRIVKDEAPSLVLLDVSLPDGNGFDYYKNELSGTGLAVLFLTARDSENDIVRGFDLGAEDYITKPFSTRELMARVNRVLKKQSVADVIKVQGIIFDRDKGEVRKEATGEVIALSSLEKKILGLLIDNHDKVVSRNAVIDCIWEATGNDVYDHTVTVYMKRIREKLGEDIITTVKGIGYRIDTHE